MQAIISLWLPLRLPVPLPKTKNEITMHNNYTNNYFKIFILNILLYSLYSLTINAQECSSIAEFAGIPEAPEITEVCFQEPNFSFAASPGHGDKPLQAGTTDYLYLIYGPNSTVDIIEINFDGALTTTQSGIYYVNGIEVDYVSMENAGIDISTITNEGELFIALIDNNICASNISQGYQLIACPEREINYNNLDGSSPINVCSNLGSIDLTGLVLEDPEGLTFNINPPNPDFDLTGTELTFPTEIVGSETVTIEIGLTPPICSNCPAMEIIQLNVLEEIKAINDTICDFDPMVMLGVENPPPSATSFIWYDDQGNELATTINAVISTQEYFALFGTPPDASADFEVEIIGENYYCQANVPVNFTVENCDPTSINSIEESRINVYPNPSTSIIYFDIKNENASNITIEIYNTKGQQVDLLTKAFILQNNKIKYNVNDLEAGIYTYQIKNDSGVFGGKFSVVK